MGDWRTYSEGSTGSDSQSDFSPTDGRSNQKLVNRLKARKTTKSIRNCVKQQNEMMRRYETVGGLAYATVRCDERIPKTDFFTQGRVFRMRIRHSCELSDDEGLSGVREAALKFKDIPTGGPWDLVLLTGPQALAHSQKDLASLLKQHSRSDLQKRCKKDSTFKKALADAVRICPETYTTLRYYSRIPYKMITKDGQACLVKFRLIPSDDAPETGLLEEYQREYPWDPLSVGHTQKRHNLNSDLERRLKSGSITYKLQAQLSNDISDANWNPQLIWNEYQCPWLDFMEINFTTILSAYSMSQTYYDIFNKPKCLQIPELKKNTDFISYHHGLHAILEKMESKRVDLVKPADKSFAESNILELGVCTSSYSAENARVELRIAITGTTGRSTPQILGRPLQKSSKDIVYYHVDAGNIGDPLTINLGVRFHRTDDEWWLAYATLGDTAQTWRLFYPHYNSVSDRVVLKPGEASLPQMAAHAVLSKERDLELSERRLEYKWALYESGLPGILQNSKTDSLPPEDKQLVQRYAHLPWNVEDGWHSQLYKQLRRSVATSQISKRGMRQLSLNEDALMKKSQREILRLNSVSEAPNKPVTPVKRPTGEAGVKARARWTKLKIAVKIVSQLSSGFADESQKEMVKLCENDVEFGRRFLSGPNPVTLRLCERVPDNFPVTDDHIRQELDNGMNLNTAIQNKKIYILDYKLLESIPTIDGYYVASAMCLMYLNKTSQLVPIAIQLGQSPGLPIWTPQDKTEDWILAKLWVVCADFLYQLFVAHLFVCHFVIEAFTLGAIRQVSSTHPVFKLLRPHLRYVIAGNTMIREKLFKKGGPLDQWTAVGVNGGKELMKRALANFSVCQLDLEYNLKSRGVYDAEALPNYTYRDDGLKVWQAIKINVGNTLGLYYKNDKNIQQDSEIQSWITDVQQNGFPTRKNDPSFGLQQQSSIEELTSMVTSVIYTATCLHNATHSHAMDIYGYVPSIPAKMLVPPPTQKGQATVMSMAKTLPEQKRDIYMGSLLALMNRAANHRGTLLEPELTFFVQERPRAIEEQFVDEMRTIQRRLQQRKLKGGEEYFPLQPMHIPRAMEPVPIHVPELAGVKEAFDKMNFNFAEDTSLSQSQATASMSLLTVPLVMGFVDSIGGRSYVKREIAMRIASSATQRGAGYKCELPTSVMHQERHIMRTKRPIPRNFIPPKVTIISPTTTT